MSIIIYISIPPVPPVITIRNQLVGAALGTELVLECETEAYPKPVSYWSRDNGEIVPVGKNIYFLYFIYFIRTHVYLLGEYTYVLAV